MKQKTHRTKRGTKKRNQRTHGIKDGGPESVTNEHETQNGGPENKISAPRSERMTKCAGIFTGNCIRTKFAHTNTTHANLQEKQMETHIPGMSRTRKPPETLQDTIKKHEKTRHRSDSELRTRRNPCAGTLPVTTDNPTGPDQTDAPTYNHAPLCFYRLRCQDHIR